MNTIQVDKHVHAMCLTLHFVEGFEGLYILYNQEISREITSLFCNFEIRGNKIHKNIHNTVQNG